MRSERSRLYAVGGRKLTGWLLLLPWHCLSCAHVRIPQDVDSPRALPALAAHMLTCPQGLELPQYGRRCPGFTRSQTTSGNQRTQQATKGLPSSADCCTMKAPEKLVRLHKGLSDFPRAGRTLVTAFAVYACRFCGQVFAHIGQVTTSDFPRGIGGLTSAGERCNLPFSFSRKLVRYSHG